jgi:hypothetical protein
LELLLKLQIGEIVFLFKLFDFDALMAQPVQVLVLLLQHAELVLSEVTRIEFCQQFAEGRELALVGDSHCSISNLGCFYIIYYMLGLY